MAGGINPFLSSRGQQRSVFDAEIAAQQQRGIANAYKQRKGEEKKMLNITLQESIITRRETEGDALERRVEFYSRLKVKTQDGHGEVNVETLEFENLEDIDRLSSMLENLRKRMIELKSRERV